MVSFSCEGCGDVLTKKKLDQHRNRCYGSSYTCIDCMVDFYGTSYRSHTSCMSEAQKYQGALYQGEKQKGNKKNKKNNDSQALAIQKQAYVEDADDEYSARPFSTYAQNLPAAPSPPPAAPDFEPEPVNVFDFLDNSQTPNASRLDLGASEPTPMAEDTPRSPNSHEGGLHQSATVQYGNGPAPYEYETPVPAARAGKKESKASSSDKKRKRLHVETQDLDTSSARDNEDALMTDAPPVLHSGLTGDLKGLLARPSVFPPSPDWSGDAADEPDQSHGAPLKKSKQAKTSSKRKGRDTKGNNFMSLITSGSIHHKHADHLPRKKKSKDTKKSSTASKKKSPSKGPSTELQVIKPAAQKLLEYKPKLKEGAVDEDTRMILHRARAELFMSFVDKGPESAKGCSMNKALRRYYRECEGLGISKERSGDEKDLWRSLRLKRNERGEVVVFF